MRVFFIFCMLLVMHTVSAMPQFTLEEIPRGYCIKLVIPDVKLEKVTIRDILQNGTEVCETFTRISVPGFSPCGKVGAPELASSHFQLALFDSAVGVELTDVVEETIKLPHTVLPMQLPKRFNTAQRYFCYKKKLYTDRNSVKRYVSVHERYTYRKQPAADITVRPLRYNPTAGTLTVLKSATVVFTMNKPHRVRSGGSVCFDKIMRDMFRNLRDHRLHEVPSEELRAKEKYLIIASPSLFDNADLRRFIDFRSKEYEVELVKSTDIGTTKDAFRKYIRDMMPAFCVLAGEYRDFPAHGVTYIGFGFVADVKSYVYYVSSDTTNPKPDICLGLFFVREEQDIANIVDKTISVEKNLDSYPQNLLSFSGDAGNGIIPGSLCDTHLERMYNDYFKSKNYAHTRIYQVSQPQGGKEECIAAINPGVRFIRYAGHGDTTSWTYRIDPNGTFLRFGIADLSRLTNTVYPFVLSAACLTGKFDGPEKCFAEAMHTHTNGAAVFIASEHIAMNQMFSLSRGLDRAIFEKNITRFGPAFVSASTYSYDSIARGIDDLQLTAHGFHYFGDPALETISSGTGINKQKKESPAYGFTISYSRLSKARMIIGCAAKSPDVSGVEVEMYDLLGKRIVRSKLTRGADGIWYGNLNEDINKKPASGVYITQFRIKYLYGKCDLIRSKLVW